MKKDKHGKKLGAEKLERRVAPGRLTYSDAPTPPDGGGSGGAGTMVQGTGGGKDHGKGWGPKDKPVQR